MEAMGRAGVITVSLLIFLHAQAVGDGPGPGDHLPNEGAATNSGSCHTPTSPQGLPWVLPRVVCVIVISI